VATEPLSPSERHPDHEHWPVWAELTTSSNVNVSNLLSIASASFERHINWFLRHSDTGIRNLAAIIAAETAIVGLYFTHFAQEGLPQALVCTLLLLVLALVVAPLLCRLAIRSATRSYIASIESVRLMTKCAWVMGLISRVSVSGAVADLPQEYRGDRFLYPERWTIGPLTGSESEFVERCLSDPKNSFSLTRRTLILICVAAGLIGCGSAAAVILRQ